MVIAGFFLMLDGHPIKLVDQKIDGSVQIEINSVRVQCVAAQVDGCLRFLLQLVHRKDALDVNDPFEVS